MKECSVACFLTRSVVVVRDSEACMLCEQVPVGLWSWQIDKLTHHQHLLLHHSHLLQKKQTAVKI